MKKIAVIYHENKPILVGTFYEVDSIEYIKFVNHAKENLEELLKDYLDTKSLVKDMKEEIEQLKKEVNFLKGVE